jgi:hypothetical protein
VKNDFKIGPLSAQYYESAVTTLKEFGAEYNDVVYYLAVILPSKRAVLGGFFFIFELK